MRNPKLVRWAALPTLLMALLNVPAGPGAGSGDVPRAVAWVATAVGLAGLVAGISLLRRVAWAPAAVVTIGVLNIAGGIAAVAAGWAGGPVGVVLGLAAVVLAAPGVAAARSGRPAVARR